MPQRTRTLKGCYGSIHSTWKSEKNKAQRAGKPRRSLNSAGLSRALHVSTIWHEGRKTTASYAEQTCISKAWQLCMNGLFLLTALTPPPPLLLKHSIQDYAANLSRRLQRPFSIHPGLLMALCRFCEVFQFQGQVNGIKYCMQLITQANVFPCCSSVGFEKEKWQEHIKKKYIKKIKNVHFGSNISQTDGMCCKCAGRVRVYFVRLNS